MKDVVTITIKINLKTFETDPPACRFIKSSQYIVSISGPETRSPEASLWKHSLEGAALHKLPISSTASLLSVSLVSMVFFPALLPSLAVYIQCQRMDPGLPCTLSTTFYH